MNTCVQSKNSKDALQTHHQGLNKSLGGHQTHWPN